jgi:hypothetical protein
MARGIDTNAPTSEPCPEVSVTTPETLPDWAKALAVAAAAKIKHLKTHESLRGIPCSSSSVSFQEK